jgi:hypothetical protein
VQHYISGGLLIALGLVYFMFPNIFRRGLWMKTSIAIRTLSEDNYRRYMKGCGIVCIAIGVALIAWGLSGTLGLHR